MAKIVQVLQELLGRIGTRLKHGFTIPNLASKLYQKIPATNRYDRWNGLAFTLSYESKDRHHALDYYHL